MMRGAVLLALVALAGCGYRPPAQTNTTAPAYAADLDACHATSVASVQKQNAKRALDWISSPVRRWSQVGDATGACMDAKGYGRLRWCTPAELAAKRIGDVVVTNAGIQCTDPPKGIGPT